MSLPSLPDLVVERIIRFAVLGEYAAEKKDFMDNYRRLYPEATTVPDISPGDPWMMRLHKYGQVSRHWKRVILQSSKLFDTKEKRLMEMNEVRDTDGSQLRQMIKEGYMERASKMELCLHEETSNEDITKTLCAIRSGSDKCSVETYDFCILDIDSHRRTRSMTRETAEYLTCIIDILKLSKKCITVEIEICLMHNQRDAENFIDFLLALVQIETITSIKFTTGFECNLDSKQIRGQAYLVTDHINWDFIKKRDFGNTKIDHIEEFWLRKIVGYGLEEYYFEFSFDSSDALTLSDFISELHGKLTSFKITKSCCSAFRRYGD